MLKTRLFIYNKEVDLAEDVQFAITKSFKNLGNPADIINDWSKTITLPFTANNNRIFGEIFNADRIILDSSDGGVGVYFDPSKKIDFTLICNNEQIMSGYMKMSSITKEKGYSINLFGSLGKVFSELSKITTVLTDENDDEKYLIDPLDGSFYITKEVVAKSWQHVRDKDSEDPFISTIGFAPYTGYNDDFESDSIELTSRRDVSPWGIDEFTTILEDNSVYVTSLYTADTIVGDGLTPRQIGDFRSYYQQPYIFVDKMFDILSDKTTELTGYTLSLDSSWFNNNNPYYNDYVMLLKAPDHDDEDQIVESGHASLLDGSTWPFRNGEPSYGPITQVIDLDTITDSSTIINNTIYINEESLFVKYDLELELKVTPARLGLYKINPNKALITTIRFYDTEDEDNYVEDTITFLDENTELNKLDYDNIIETGHFSKFQRTGDIVYETLDLEVAGYMMLKKYQFGSHGIKMRMKMEWDGPAENALAIDYLDTTFEGILDSNQTLVQTVKYSSVMNYENKKGNRRSYDLIQFNDLWDSDYSFFDMVLKYTKMFNLIWITDDLNKIIRVVPLYKYFSEENTILDWTDKINYDSNYSIEPLIYDARYYKLGYEDSELSLGSSYLSKYGINYGDYIVNTKYNFDENTNTLIEGLKAPIVATKAILDWDSIYKGEVIYKQSSEPMICLSDDEDGRVNMFGAFFFYRGLKDFDIDIRRPVLSDDTQNMENIDKFCYIENGENGGGLRMESYPYIDIIYNSHGNILGGVFGRPAVKYDIMADYSSMADIYSRCWKRYLSENTNLQNHKLTAYVKLTLQDILNFKFNKFVKIGNQVYLVNKISDYSFDETTKCEMIKVYDMNNYRTYEDIVPLDEFVTIIRQNITVKDSNNYLSMQLKTNIDNFGRDNISIEYNGTHEGTLETYKFVIWSNNVDGVIGYNVYFKQVNCDACKISGTIIIRGSNGDILSRTRFNIDNSMKDSEIIENTGFKILSYNTSVSDFSSQLMFIIRSAVPLTREGIEFTNKNGSGSLIVSSMQLLAATSIFYKYQVTLTQTGYSPDGGNGDITIINTVGTTMGRLPFRIAVTEEGATYIKYLPASQMVETDGEVHVITFSMETNKKWEITSRTNINNINYTSGDAGTYVIEIECKAQDEETAKTSPIIEVGFGTEDGYESSYSIGYKSTSN